MYLRQLENKGGFNLKYIFHLLFQKVLGIINRMMYFILSLPTRFWRLIQHIWKGLLSLRIDSKEWYTELTQGKTWASFFRWWIALILYLLDLIGIGELHDTIMDLFKFNTRRLYDWEIELGKTIFGDSIKWQLVSIDNRAFLGPKQKHFAYVSFHSINSWNTLSNSVLLHEFIHIWQYEKFGSVYMLKAIQAQKSALKYNYGGVNALYKAVKEGKSLLSFNFEQQGDIVADYYKIKNGYAPQWGRGKREDLDVYEQLLGVLKF